MLGRGWIGCQLVPLRLAVPQNYLILYIALLPRCSRLPSIHLVPTYSITAYTIGGAAIHRRVTAMDLLATHHHTVHELAGILGRSSITPYVLSHR